MYVDLSGFGQLLRTKVVNGLDHPTAVSMAPAEVSAIGAFLDPTSRPLCSGALVTPHAVLSAAHCGVRPGDAFVTGPDARRPESRALVASVVRHPRWAGPRDDHMIALLDRVLPAAALPVSPVAPEAGDEIQGVGYGMTQPDTEGNTLRWWTAEPVTAVAARSFTVSGRGLRGLCNGDSGGPALAMRDGSAAIVGTVSQGEISCVGDDLYSIPDLAWISSVLSGWKSPGSVPLLRRAWVGPAVGIVMAAVGVGFVVVTLRRASRNPHRHRLRHRLPRHPTRPA